MSVFIPTEGLKEKFNQEFENLKNSIKSPNILILGQTGVGKSSLINTIFGLQLANVSNIKPETKGFHLYSNPGFPINIIDSEGYELANSNQFKDSLSEYINENFATADKQIHIAWYCISISNSRILPYDIENLSYLIEKQKIPTVVVFTQCDNDTPEGSIANQLTKEVDKHFGGRIPCFQVSNDKEINESLDIVKLTDWSIDNLSDDNLKTAFLIAQKVNLNAKFKKAKLAIAGYAVSAAAIGASPIPMSDAALLIPLQTAMAATIFWIYGLSNNSSTLFKNVIWGRVVSMLGKTAVGNIVKFFPGIGSVVGAAINGTVASTITYSLGYALSSIAKKAIENEWEGNIETFDTIFTEENINFFVDEYKNIKKK